MKYVHKPTKVPKHFIKKYHPVCIDNFFDDPKLIRDFGLKLPLTPDSTGAWPGARSQNIMETHHELGALLILKILSAYYDIDYHLLSWESSTVQFQSVNKFDNKKTDATNKGWIHQDAGSSLAALIYLSPNIDIESGTSIFRKNNKQYSTFQTNPQKHLLLKNKKINKTLYEKEFKINQESFEETIKFGNVYNRMIAYDANEWHRANSYFNEERFFMVFFIAGLKIDGLTPMERVKNKIAFDDPIKNVIGSL